MSGFSSHAARRAPGERGLTLIEVTLLLTVSIAMIGGLMPVLSETLLHAETVRATQDMNNISLALNNALTELAGLGFTFFTVDGTPGGTQVTLLVSDGDIPRELAGAGDPAWQALVDNAAGLSDFLERHLVTNNPRGSVANDYPIGGAAWRGAYMAAPIDPDPWGNRYMVNADSFDTGNDTVVLSAGPNEVIETPFVGVPLLAGGDDLVVLVQ